MLRHTEANLDSIIAEQGNSGNNIEKAQAPNFTYFELDEVYHYSFSRYLQIFSSAILTQDIEPGKT